MAKAEITLKLPWLKPEELKPYDGEHIICLFGNSSEWSDWRYFAENKTIRRKHGMAGAIPIYECYPLDAIAYWMRILTPESFK